MYPFAVPVADDGCAAVPAGGGGTVLVVGHGHPCPVAGQPPAWTVAGLAWCAQKRMISSCRRSPISAPVHVLVSRRMWGHLPS